MLRPKGKPTKIAFKILGKPENLKDKNNRKDRRIDNRLIFEETYREK